MKFREHRGGLAESMETCVELEPTLEAIRTHLLDTRKKNAPVALQQVGSLSAQLYTDGDDRIGWDKVFIVMEDNAVAGFTDTLPATDPDSEKKRIIVQIVSDNPGVKGTILAAEFVDRLHKSSPSEKQTYYGENYLDLVNALVDEGKIIEVEYVVPTMSYRVKSLYFPKGTEITVVKKE